MGDRAKVRSLQPAVWARPLEFTAAAVLVTVPNMSLVQRDFLSFCPSKERDGLWTNAHPGTCFMKVTYQSCEFEKFTSYPSINGVAKSYSA